MCALRKKAHLQSNYKPAGSAETIAKGVYYLENVDAEFKREYAIKA